MKRALLASFRRALGTSALAVALAGCPAPQSDTADDDDKKPDTTCEDECDPEPEPEPVADPEPEGPVVELPPSDNLLDAVVGPAFVEAGRAPVMASGEELCRRMSADLLGRYLSETEVAVSCAGKTAQEIATDFQSRPDYFVHAQRRWRDRFDTTDVDTDWRYLKSLYRLVDKVHSGELPYDEFAISVLSHPGFLLSETYAEGRARQAFRLFLGRTATDAEAADLASVFRPWVPAAVPDPDFSYLYVVQVQLLPVLCEPIASCTSTILGGGTLSLNPALGGAAINFDDLNEETLAAIRVPGEMVVAQSYFWEAVADELLDRLLDWDNGARNPRRPSYLFPGLQQQLAGYLQQTGDYPGAERMVLTSWLYSQTSNVDAAALDEEVPVYLSGPVKSAMSEVWLNTALSLLDVDLGQCDPRYSDGFPYSLIYQALGDELITLEQAGVDFELLNAMRDDLMPLSYDSGYAEPDYRYLYFARLIGGCPGFQAQRQSAAGLAFALTQESLAELLCTPMFANNAYPSGDITPESTLVHQMRLLLGRSPVEGELDVVRAAATTCEGDDCSEDGIVRSVCVALLGSAEMQFY